MQPSISHKMFDHAFLSGVGDHVSNVNSHVVPVGANTARIDATLVNSVGLVAGKVLSIYLEGSYDGRAWMTTGLGGTEQKISFESGLENDSSAVIGDVDYAYLRMRAELLAPTNQSALFSVSLVFTQQA